jgi:hypothetical protein
MLNRALKFSASSYKVVVLVAVYALHLTLFQLVMTQTVHASNSNFKPLFYHTDKTKPLNPPSHPAVSYYNHLVKQGLSGLRSCCQVDAVQCDFKLFELPQSIKESEYLLYPVHILSHIGADSFKLYRLLRVFLI